MKNSKKIFGIFIVLLMVISAFAVIMPSMSSATTTYTITFKESGVPTGDYWGFKYNATGNSTMVLTDEEAQLAGNWFNLTLASNTYYFYPYTDGEPQYNASPNNTVIKVGLTANTTIKLYYEEYDMYDPTAPYLSALTNISLGFSAPNIYEPVKINGQWSNITLSSENYYAPNSELNYTFYPYLPQVLTYSRAPIYMNASTEHMYIYKGNMSMQISTPVLFDTLSFIGAGSVGSTYTYSIGTEPFYNNIIQNITITQTQSNSIYGNASLKGQIFNITLPTTVKSDTSDIYINVYGQAGIILVEGKYSSVTHNVLAGYTGNNGSAVVNHTYGLAFNTSFSYPSYLHYQSTPYYIPQVMNKTITVNATVYTPSYKAYYPIQILNPLFSSYTLTTTSNTEKYTLDINGKNQSILYGNGIGYYTVNAPSNWHLLNPSLPTYLAYHNGTIQSYNSANSTFKLNVSGMISIYYKTIVSNPMVSQFAMLNPAMNNIYNAIYMENATSSTINTITGNSLANYITNITNTITSITGKTTIQYGNLLNLSDIKFGQVNTEVKTTWGSSYNLNFMGAGYSFSNKTFTVQGVVNPKNATIIAPISDLITGTGLNTYSSNNSYIGEKMIQPNATGAFKFTTYNNSIVFVFEKGYMPQKFIINSAKVLNITLSTLSLNFNIANITDYNMSKGGILNVSKANIGTAFTTNGIMFSKISANSFYIAPILSLAGKNITAPTMPLTFNISVIAHKQYIMMIQANTTQPLIKYTFSSNTSYYKFEWDTWSIDPIFTYSTDQAIISVPSIVPYDSAVIISGASSTPSTNATITSYVWSITGPATFSGNGQTITEFFALTGIYTIDLTITDSNGLINTTTTSITVVSSKQDLNIIITDQFTTLKNGNVYLNITVNAKDNVSVSQLLVKVGSVYVNTTLISKVGYIYHYSVKLLEDKYAYGNYTIVITAWNSADQYNSLTSHYTFGSINGLGIIGYITTNTLLLLVVAFLIVVIVIFAFSMDREHNIKMRRYKRKNRR